VVYGDEQDPVLCSALCFGLTRGRNRQYGSLYELRCKGTHFDMLRKVLPINNAKWRLYAHLIGMWCNL
jgi:hypothetical protein